MVTIAASADLRNGAGTARIGQLALRDAAATGLHGTVEAYYRPEDVELSPGTPDAAAGADLTVQVGRILRTRPLARISLRCAPPTALMLHKDIDRLQLTTGDPVQVNLPPGSLRLFPANA
jgi:hypothetical protein